MNITRPPPTSAANAARPELAGEQALGSPVGHLADDVGRREGPADRGREARAVLEALMIEEQATEGREV